MKGKKLKYSVSVAVLASTFLATPTFASPVDSPVTQGQIIATQQQIDDFETKMQQLDNRITEAMVKSQKLNDAIKMQQGKIEESKIAIEKAKKSLDAHKKVYSERLKSIQSQGQQPIITYAELLLSSKDISEFLTRTTAISQFIQSDTDLLNGLKQKEQALKAAEDELHNQLENLKNSQAELAAEQKDIEDSKAEVAKQLADSQNILQQQQAKLAQQQAEQQREQELAQQRAEQQAQQQAQQLAQQSQAAQQPAAVNTPSAQPATAASLSDPNMVNRIIATAKQYLGVPYVWGGTTPSGFDCSGFTSYVFRAVGINLPRVARDQQHVGTRISPTQVQAGDLVFRGDPAYHVGIYIGGGLWIQAPETGDVVKISAYNPSKFASAARVIK